MKKFILYYIVALLCTNTCLGQNNKFILNGKVIGRDTGRIILAYCTLSGKYIEDTALLKNGRFVFTGITTSQPSVAVLHGHLQLPSFNIYDPNLLSFFIEPSKINIKLRENDYRHAIVSGSPTQMENNVLQSQLEPLLKVLIPLNNKYSKLVDDIHYYKKPASEATLNQIKEIRKDITPLMKQRDSIYYAFLLAHPDSYVSADILANKIYPTKLGGDSALMYYSRLSIRMQNSNDGRDAYNAIISYLKAKQASSNDGLAAIGSQAPEFPKEFDLIGNRITLGSYIGKNYVLLDFWASWCGPCLQAMSAIKGFYSKYKNNGLQVVGISMDITREKWLSALKEDSLSLWPQVYAGSFSTPGNFAKENYGVLLIPQFILIDKIGKIIGRYTGLDDASSGDTLADQLNAIFPK